MNKVIKDWLKKYMPYHSERERDERAKELLFLIDQQGEPVGWVSSYQLEQVASDPRILGVVTTLYKHKPEGTTFHVPLYLHPPASREREALEDLALLSEHPPQDVSGGSFAWERFEQINALATKALEGK